MNADRSTEAAMRAARSIGEMVTVHFGEALYSSMLESMAAIINCIWPGRDKATLYDGISETRLSSE